MNLWLKMLPLFVLSAALESATHIFLKKGAQKYAELSGLNYLATVLQSRQVWFGIATFVVESLIWLWILALLPLSLAFPTSGLQKLVMVVITVMVFREKLSRRELQGMLLISMGLICIALSAGAIHD